MKPNSVVLLLGLTPFLFACGRSLPPGPPLVRAAALGRLPQLQTLLGAGAAPDVPDPSGFTALMHASRAGHLEIIHELLAAGADPDLAMGRNHWTALLHAIHKHQVGSIEALLEGGAAVDAPGGDGLTPLMMAAGYGQEDVVRILLAHGADVWRLNGRHEGVLEIALAGIPDLDDFTLGHCQGETVRTLLEHDPELRRQSEQLSALTRLYVHLRCPEVEALLHQP